MSAPQERVPPYSIEAEQSVIGGLLLDNRSFDIVSSRVNANDFYREDHRFIFRSIAALAEEGKPLDWITLSEWLKQRNELEQAGGANYLGTLAKDTPSAANIKHYADIVAERSQKRQYITFLTDQLEKAYAGGDESAMQLLDQAESKLFALGERTRKGSSKVKHAKEVLKLTLDDIQRLSELKEGEIPGLPSPWASSDELTGGPEAGDLVVVAGRPAMGKTVFAGCWELDAAKRGKPVLTFSLEMPAAQLMKRHISRASSVPFTEVKRGRIPEESWVRVAGQAVKPISKYPLFIDDTPGVTVGDIRAEARRIHRQCQKEYGTGLELIVIDYLQLIEMPGVNGDGNRASQIGDITRALKLLARELGCVVLLLSQLNRGVEQRPDKRPMMSDLRESGAIEQDADVCIFLYRDEVYYEDSADKGVTEVIYGKGRNFEIGTVRLASQLQFQRFVEYTPEVEYA